MNDDSVAAQLGNGRMVRIRTLLPTDGPGVFVFSQVLAVEGTQLGRGTSSDPAGPTLDLRHVAADEDHDGEAIVALDGRGRIIAVGRYEPGMPTPEGALVAVVIAEAWRRTGVGTHLLHQLARRARVAGISTFVGARGSDARRIRQVFGHSGDIGASPAPAPLPASSRHSSLPVPTT